MSLNMKCFYLTLQNYINQSMALKLLFLVQDLALFIKKVPIDLFKATDWHGKK